MSKFHRSDEEMDGIDHFSHRKGVNHPKLKKIPTDEVDVTNDTYSDREDPFNIRSEDEDCGDEENTPDLETSNVLLSSSPGRDGIAQSKMTLTTYKRLVEVKIASFFVHGDFDETITDVIELDCPQFGYELVKRIINMSLDKGDRERELVSKFLSVSYPDVLSSNMIGKGFERLFEIVDEIEKDAPSAKAMLSKFLARAVLDEIISPAFLGDPVVCNLGGEVVEHSKRMLTREHAGAKLESCWGPGDGRPVSELKRALDQLLEEYVLSGDIAEATRCIQELNASHFYHEVVKRAVVNVLDKSSQEQTAMSALLLHLFTFGKLSAQQALKGFNRLYGIIGDLSLDTPNALAILQGFTARAIDDLLLPSTYTAPTSTSAPGPITAATA